MITENELKGWEVSNISSVNEFVKFAFERNDVLESNETVTHDLGEESHTEVMSV